MSKRYLLFVPTLIALTSNAADYEQLPGHFGGFDSDPQILVADDFQLGQQTLIGGLIWWGGDYNPPPSQDDFTVKLYLDSEGHPGSVMAQFAFGVVSKNATGQYVNAPGLYPEYEYSATFTSPFVAQAGVKYWVSIGNYPSGFWLWEASGSSLNPGVQRSFNGGDWQPYLDNTAFELITVPEPNGAIIMAALASAILYSRRKNAR